MFPRGCTGCHTPIYHLSKENNKEQRQQESRRRGEEILDLPIKAI